MSVLWEAFKVAVYKAQDERTQEARRTRALERIAESLEALSYQAPDERPVFYTPPPQPKGK